MQYRRSLLSLAGGFTRSAMLRRRGGCIWLAQRAAAAGLALQPSVATGWRLR